MSKYACAYCEGEHTMDPLCGEEGDAKGLYFCDTECLMQFYKAGEPGQPDGPPIAPISPPVDHSPG